MNIFEQYGIRDVANVTLYSITYDKYDNEVYIPVIYFDTLKVSSVEQSAEQTSARGGLGNTEHVIWDYNKEINVTLQDALYTPASQNLLWGGFYGLKNMRIKGYWDEYEYDIDEDSEEPLYFEKKVGTKETLKKEGIELEDSENSKIAYDKNGVKYIKFICPCDDQEKYIGFIKKSPKTQSIEGNNIFRKKKDVTGTTNVTINGQAVKVYKSSDFSDNFHCKPAEITVVNFGKFIHSIGEIDENYAVAIKNYETPRTVLELHSDNYKVNIDEEYRLLEYRWNECDMAMSTTSHNVNLAFREDVDFVYHSHYDNNNKRLLFVEDNQYSAALEFYITINKIIVDSEGEEHLYSFEVPIGKFYIAEDLNIPQPEEEYAIYNIVNNSNRVKYVDTLVKLVAPDTFAIDVDKNIMSYQYSQMPEYAQTELTVFLDPNTMKPFENNSIRYTTQKGLTITGNLRIIRKDDVYYKWERRKTANDYAQGKQIIVNAKTFPGAFRLVGETYIRDRFGKEQRLQIDIPLCKLSSNTNLNLTADGEPVTVDMSLKAMRKQDGTLVKFTYYDVDDNCLVPFDYKIPKPIINTQVTKSSFDTCFVDEYNDTVIATDIVYYKNLIPNTIYEIRTEIWNITNNPKKIDFEIPSTIFSPELENGSQTIKVEFPRTAEEMFVKSTYVFVEFLYQNNKLIASHKQLNDINQQFYVEPTAPPEPPVLIIELEITSPSDEEVYCLPRDCQPPYNGEVDTYITFSASSDIKDNLSVNREQLNINYLTELGEPIQELQEFKNSTKIYIERGEAT